MTEKQQQRQTAIRILGRASEPTSQEDLVEGIKPHLTDVVEKLFDGGDLEFQLPTGRYRITPSGVDLLRRLLKIESEEVVDLLKRLLEIESEVGGD